MKITEFEKIVRWLYRDATIYLNRKYEKVRILLESINRDMNLVLELV